MLVMLGEGGETNYSTNINFLLEEFGIAINNGGLAAGSLYMCNLPYFRLCCSNYLLQVFSSQRGSCYKRVFKQV